MLNALRESSGSWVVKIFLGLLVLSFAAWGIGDIFRLKPDAAVVEVGDTKITGYEFLNEFNRQVRRMQASLGPTFDSAQARQLGMVDQVLQQSITRALYDQEVAELALTMSDADIAAWIRQSSAFKNSFGRFDKLLFERRLSENGFNEQSYIAASRRDLSREQLFSSIMGGTPAPAPLVKTFYKYQQETRVFEVLSLPYEKVTDFATPSEADLAAYHKAHKDQFMAPEYRALTYLTIRPEHMLEEILASEVEVRDAYEARLAEFSTPASREVEQIVVADEAAAKTLAGRLKDGGDFYAVAKELADMDIQSVKLGQMQKGDLPEKAADRVFALAMGQISEPIETGLGWHVFRVLKIVEGGRKSFDEMRSQLTRDVKFEKAAEAMSELANKVEDMLASGANVNEVAETLNLQQGVIAAVDSRGRGRGGQPVAGLPKAPELLRQAFTIAPGEEGELKESTDGSYYLVQVNKIFEATLEPIAKVRDGVRKAVLTERRAKAGAAQAVKLADEARRGKTLAELARSGGSAVTALKPLSRQQAAGDIRLSAELVKKLFQLRIGEIAEGTTQSGDSHSVVRVVSIASPGDNVEPAKLKSMDEFVRSSIAEDILAQYRDALRHKYNVKIHDDMIDSLFDELNVRG
ncbi:MAG: SurA N-terminal domain-containing protein [Alphaproteobacteria bacterium]|nr:SurA N-terminal domain-containing protein [Alphaproteobacteria bacterium]